MKLIFYYLITLLLGNIISSFSLFPITNSRILHLTLSMKDTATNIDTLNFSISQRIIDTERPYIEDVLDKYASIDNITILALGSSYWLPPNEALQEAKLQIMDREIQRYGNIEGYPKLREMLKDDLINKGLDFENLDLVITSGANQAFVNTALALIDNGDSSIIISPYYFSHKLALQLAKSDIHVCSFNKVDLKPNWSELESLFKQHKPKLIVITNPNNPSGIVWTYSEIKRIVDMCKEYKTWLVVDQTYHEFLFDGVSHVFPCSKKFNYDQIIHIFSMSKSFGIPGWRVGYLVAPKYLSEHLRKLQDTIPTHATMLSQKLAIACLNENLNQLNSKKLSFVNEKVNSLILVREKLIPLLQDLGTIISQGAFYFLIPVPNGVSS